MYEILPPIELGKLKSVELHFPRITGNSVKFLVWHISTLLNLPPTINEIILIVDDLDGFLQPAGPVGREAVSQQQQQQQRRSPNYRPCCLRLMQSIRWRSGSSKHVEHSSRMRL